MILLLYNSTFVLFLKCSLLVLSNRILIINLVLVNEGTAILFVFLDWMRLIREKEMEMLTQFMFILYWTELRFSVQCCDLCVCVNF